MIVEIEVLPQPPGTPEHHYRHVEAAIAVIQAAGVGFEVEALGTTYEAPPDQAWALARSVHEACLASGADAVVTIIKVAQAADGGPTMAGLTSGFRS